MTLDSDQKLMLRIMVGATCLVLAVVLCGVLIVHYLHLWGWLICSVVLFIAIGGALLRENV